MKVANITQPQSSCPFQAADQKIFGLGYGLLVFVYEKTDDPMSKMGRLNFLHIIYIDKLCTGNFQTTRGIRQIVEGHGNEEDLIAFMTDRNLPIDSIQAKKLAAKILHSPPSQGYLTISNALQWRLQYGRAISEAGNVDGILRL